MATAQAVTGSAGNRLSYGFDSSNMFVDSMGERIRVVEREVSFIAETTLDDVLNNDKYMRFNLLANTILNNEKVHRGDTVGVYASGIIRELRVGKNRYRMRGNKYYGNIK